MLTRQMPYPDLYDLGDWIEAVKAGAPVAPERLRAGVPLELSKLVLEMLALRPEERPADAAAVIRELRRVVDDTPKPLEVRVHPKDGLKYVWIPPGEFRMGASEGDSECLENEKPAHEVRITKGFWMGQTPVTVGAYGQYVRDTGGEMPVPAFYNPGWNDDSLPVTNVSWEDARAYCKWAGLRLPRLSRSMIGSRPTLPSRNFTGRAMRRSK